MRILQRLFALVAFVALVAFAADAQNTGTVGIATKHVPVCWSAPCTTASPTTTTGTSLAFENSGQAAHVLTYCYSGSTTNLQIFLEESFDGSTNWIPFSQIGGTTGTFGGNCNFIQGGGYYKFVRAHLNQLGGSSASVTAWYSSSAAPVNLFQAGQGTMGIVIPAACDFQNAVTFADNTKGTLKGNPTAGGSLYVCNLAITYNGTPTQTGVVNIYSEPTGTCGSATPGGIVKYFTGSATPILLGSGYGQLFNSGIGADLCAQLVGVGASVVISIGYASY